MTISASVATANMAQANAELAEAGLGPGNFSVPLRTGTAEATHAGLHAWDDADFLTALQALTVPVTIRNEPGQTVNFTSHVQAESLEWTDPANWLENPVMTGDQRTFNGKTWVSLTDYNVWQPPIAWREAAENPAWVQPTGAHDAYPQGFSVTHNGQVWVSDIDANVWEPGVFGWTAA